MLAHQVEGEGEDLGPVGGAAPVPWVVGSVGRPALELHHEVDHRLVLLGVGPDIDVRVPGDGGVEVVKEPVAHHEELAAQRFFGRRAVEADGARELTGLDEFLDRQGRADTGGAEQVVAAAVARRPGLERLLGRLGALRDPGEGVVLTENADDRMAFAIGRDEGGGQSGHAPVDREALGFEIVLEEGGGPGLPEPGFGKGPDLIGETDQLGPVGVDHCNGLVLEGFEVGRRRRRGGDCTHQ